MQGFKYFGLSMFFFFCFFAFSATTNYTHALYKSMPFFMLYSSSSFFMQGESVVSYFHSLSPFVPLVSLYSSSSFFMQGESVVPYFHSLSPFVPLVSLFNFNHTHVLYRSMSFFTQDTSFLSFYPMLFLSLFWATHKAILSSHEARTPFLSIYFFFYSRLFLSHSISPVTPGASLLSF